MLREATLDDFRDILRVPSLITQRELSKVRPDEIEYVVNTSLALTACEIDGNVVAMFGVRPPTVIAHYGEIWFVLKVTKPYHLRAIRSFRGLTSFIPPSLTHVNATVSDPVCRKFAIWAGFRPTSETTLIWERP